MGSPGCPRVVERINSRYGTRYALRNRLDGGRQGGAWVVRDDRERDPSEAVLTWTVNTGLAARRPQTAALVAALRARGYPTPEWRLWGRWDDGLTFVIADFVHGEAAAWSTLDPVVLISVVERQADVAGAAPDSWSHYLRHALVADDGLQRDVSGLGTVGADFLARLDATAPRLAGTDLPTSDAVHGDMEIGNLLVTRPASGSPGISVVDIDACGPGTRALDYAWLYRDAITHGAPTATARELRVAGIAVAGPDAWAACLALACLEVAAFVARSGDTTQALREITRLTPLLIDP